jgi:hypothetical protein
MNSFQETYCAGTGCSPVQFRRRVFWRCLPPMTRLAAPLFGGMNSEYFSADRDLIASAGRAASVAQIRDEIRDYFHDPRNQLWLRGKLRLRLSTARLRALARAYLPDEPVPLASSAPRTLAISGATQPIPASSVDITRFTAR